jgi:hypothetical protein
MDSSLREELLHEMEQLSPSLQRRVLAYARTIADSTPEGTPGKDLLEFAGIMSPEEADEFLRGIEEGCERLDGTQGS